MTVGLGQTVIWTWKGRLVDRVEGYDGGTGADDDIDVAVGGREG